MTTITDEVKSDALRALGARLDERHEQGVRWGTSPREWSDEAQTVGWCRDLLERWPQDWRRVQMTALLAGFGVAA